MFERMDEAGRMMMQLDVEQAFEEVHRTRRQMARKLADLAEEAAVPETASWAAGNTYQFVEDYTKAEAKLQTVVRMFHTMCYAFGGKEVRDEAKAWIEDVSVRTAGNGGTR